MCTDTKRKNVRISKHGMQIWCTRLLDLHLLGFKEPRALESVGLEEPPTSATFMCRIYLVAYKFRFDFILWREPSMMCASGCNVS